MAVSIFVLIPLIKNTILYFSYNHKPTILLRENDHWYGVFDRVSWMGDGDFRVEVALKQINDSTGTIKILLKDRRINGRQSTYYGWNALLPYSDNVEVVRNDTVQLVRKYIPYMRVNWDKAYLYQISNDSLYISSFFPPEYSEKAESKNDYEIQRLLAKRFLSKLFKPSENSYEWGIAEDTEVYGSNDSYADVLNFNSIWKEWVKLYREIID